MLQKLGINLLIFSLCSKREVGGKYSTATEGTDEESCENNSCFALADEE
jgi:hypothetical protein